MHKDIVVTWWTKTTANKHVLNWNIFSQISGIKYTVAIALQNNLYLPCYIDMVVSEYFTWDCILLRMLINILFSNRDILRTQTGFWYADKSPFNSKSFIMSVWNFPTNLNMLMQQIKCAYYAHWNKM